MTGATATLVSTQPTIGLLGGHTLVALGPPAQLHAFFQALTATCLDLETARIKQRPLADHDRLQGNPFWLR